MRRTLDSLIVVGVLLVVAAAALVAQATPRLATVAPDSAKAGDVVTTEGENLEKAKVAEIYLTDGKADQKMEIVEQAEKSIKFKLPASVKTGRFSLMLLTAGGTPTYLEQPVKLTVE